VLARLDTLRFIDLRPNIVSCPTTLTLAYLRSGLTTNYVLVQTLYRSGQSKINLIGDGIRILLFITKITTFFSPFRMFLPVSVFFFLVALGTYLPTYLTACRLANMLVSMWTTAVIIFMLGLAPEQIAA